MRPDAEALGEAASTAKPGLQNLLNHQTIGVIGLGLMGTALTERLLEHGYRVVVWNRTREKVVTLEAQGASTEINKNTTKVNDE